MSQHVRQLQPAFEVAKRCCVCNSIRNKPRPAHRMWSIRRPSGFLGGSGWGSADLLENGCSSVPGPFSVRKLARQDATVRRQRCLLQVCCGAFESRLSTLRAAHRCAKVTGDGGCTRAMIPKSFRRTKSRGRTPDSSTGGEKKLSRVSIHY